jgi:hypothetical protein
MADLHGVRERRTREVHPKQHVCKSFTDELISRAARVRSLRHHASDRPFISLTKAKRSCKFQQPFAMVHFHDVTHMLQSKFAHHMPHAPHVKYTKHVNHVTLARAPGADRPTPKIKPNQGGSSPIKLDQGQNFFSRHLPRHPSTIPTSRTPSLHHSIIPSFHHSPSSPLPTSHPKLSSFGAFRLLSPASHAQKPIGAAPSFGVGEARF